VFARTVRVALAAAAATDGFVDPTLGRALEAAGYDRDFDALGADPRPPGPAERGRAAAVRLDGRLLSRPSGLRLDLNGVVKALAVDEALARVSGHAAVSAGGDAAVRGETVVGVPAARPVRLRSGGVATSGTTRRRWRRGGRLQHHLIDPRTGRPSRSRWTAVTVAAESCLAADVAAKSAFLHGDDGPAWLDERGLPGLFAEGESQVPNAAWRSATSRVDPVAA
jgi:thiamine biosynthesis lipoprotein